MQTLILKLEYDGTEYGGWQIQPNAITIQGQLEKAFSKLLDYKINVIAAGRTDAGVHARGMIAHAELNRNINIPESKLSNVLNTILPNNINIIAVKKYSKKFHARFDAIARQYSYMIHNKDTVFHNYFSTFVKYKLDYGILVDSANIFLGKYNFTTFSKLNPDTKSYICKVEKSYWEKIDDNCLRYHVKADRFVYGMVRSLVGAMIDAGRGKRTLEDLKKSLDLGDRKFISPLAPPQGLILEKIYYPAKIDFFD